MGLAENIHLCLENEVPSPFIIFIRKESPFNAFDLPDALGPINRAPFRVSLSVIFVFSRIEYLDAVKSNSVLSLNERKFVRYILVSIVIPPCISILSGSHSLVNIKCKKITLRL